MNTLEEIGRLAIQLRLHNEQVQIHTEQAAICNNQINNLHQKIRNEAAIEDAVSQAEALKKKAEPEEPGEG